MRKKVYSVLFLLIGSISWASSACIIESYPQIIRTNKTSNVKHSDIIKESKNCSESEKRIFASTVLNSEGVFSSSRFFKESKLKNITVQPNKITIVVLENFLSEKFNLLDSWHWEDLKLNNRTHIIGTSSNSSVSVSCSNCQAPGEKSISINIHNASGEKSSTVWAQGNLLVQTMALVSKKHLPVNHKALSAEDFELKTISTTAPAKFFTNQSKLKFYKVNRNLTSGDPILFSYLMPISLVKPGQAADIFLNSSNIQLKGQAVPTKVGTYGEIITLQNTRTKKQIVGKVVDYNKVLVEP